MILRDYECAKCQVTFDDIHTEAEPAKCPKCGSVKVIEKASVYGSYGIKGDNSASVTPRHGGSFKRKR